MLDEKTPERIKIENWNQVFSYIYLFCLNQFQCHLKHFLVVSRKFKIIFLSFKIKCRYLKVLVSRVGPCQNGRR